MSNTAERLLDTAQALVQTRGYNAFSFGDLAGPLDLTKAGVHYHFPSKADLGRALVARYRRAFADALSSIDDADGNACARLEGFAGLYADVLRKERLCLCGMLSAEAATLPGEVQREVRAFFAETEAWLARTLEEGRADGQLRFEGTPEEAAALVLAAVEGAMLTAWPGRFEERSGAVRDAVKQFEAVTGRLLAGLKAR